MERRPDRFTAVLDANVIAETVPESFRNPAHTNAMLYNRMEEIGLRQSADILRALFR